MPATATKTENKAYPALFDAAAKHNKIPAMADHFEDATVLETINSADAETDNLTHFELGAGETSFRDRIANLIDEGHPITAVNLLDTALSGADNETIDDIIGTALSALKKLETANYGEEARLLEYTLSDWGIDAPLKETKPATAPTPAATYKFTMPAPALMM